MIQPTTQQAFLLADFYHQIGTSISAYLDAHQDLGDKERNQLCDQQVEILRLSGKMNMFGTSLVFDDVSNALKSLGEISTGVNTALQKALNVQNVINLAASIVSLGTSILSKDPKAIGTKAMEITKSLKAI